MAEELHQLVRRTPSPLDWNALVKDDGQQEGERVGDDESVRVGMRRERGLRCRLGCLRLAILEECLHNGVW
jgi:hypothetical protein